jgi:hypothetical protein
MVRNVAVMMRRSDMFVCTSSLTSIPDVSLIGNLSLVVLFPLPSDCPPRWLNATQILKVAGVNKTARTKYLDREISKGVHQKIQGGYGKYQGTW